MKCGSHQCRKTCHKPGECEDAQQHCQQRCGKPKKACAHPCELPCHAPSTCKEDRPCPCKIIITCDCQRKKEEVRCNARSGLSELPGRQTSLKCDDECARLERNRNLALALHISDDHTDDHVPYSNATLQMYLEDVAWAHKQEEIFRLFAADKQEKRYRFPPMKPRQRQFIHLISEDFGFDTESLDPEPHRHVMVFKTPKFVAAPMKTLAQAARVRRVQPTIAAAAQTVQETKEIEPDFNGLLLVQPRFALTEDELRDFLTAVVSTLFEITFLPDEQGVALVPTTSDYTDLSTLQRVISTAIVNKDIASSVLLAALDRSGFEPRLISTQARTTAAATGGWSQVAAKRAAPVKQAPQVAPVGQRPIYTVLGSKLAEARRKKQEDEELLKKLARQRKEAVVDDWEAEAEKEEVKGQGGDDDTIEKE
jgi:transcriptional repressor NF-X1